MLAQSIRQRRGEAAPVTPVARRSPINQAFASAMASQRGMLHDTELPATNCSDFDTVHLRSAADTTEFVALFFLNS